MGKSEEFFVERRDFLKSAMIAGVATLALSGEKANADEVAPAAQALPPGEVEGSSVEGSSIVRFGADYMTDVIKTLPFDFICANPGDKFAGLQESMTGAYGGNKNPEWITCTHEEISVAMGHGYFKIEGKPICVCAHGTVGLQHAAMAIYNAYCDRVPVYLIVGNSLDNPGNHSVQDAASMVRDYIRWDSAPASLKTFAESAVRAYGYAMTPPMMPVLITADAETQDAPMPKGPEPLIPKLTIPQPPEGDSGSVAEAARLLVQAQNPLILVDKYARTQAGTDRLVELAELLQIPVIDEAGRMNFPNRHSLNQSFAREGLVANADVILSLEVSSLYQMVHNAGKAKIISIGADGLYTKGNYLDTGRYQPVDLAISADAETTMLPLVEAVKRQLTPNQKAAAQVRGAKLAARQQKTLEQARVDSTYAWNASPVSTARLNAELWEAVKNEDWSFVSYIMHFSWWPLRTWPMEKHYQWNGNTGGNGMGYNAPAALGAALANKKYGRFTVNIQGDGDLMYAPGVLWTAAHHKIPILNVMHNNRCYHQELMGLQGLACRMNRNLESPTNIGVMIDNPNIDYAKMAASMGVYSEGPITDPKDVGPALRRAVAVVKRGEPALVDVITQPR